MASTAKGRAAINDMLSEKTGTVLTDLSNLPAGTLSNPPANTRTVDKKLMMTSSRYFTVRLGSGGVDVSDVLYTDDHDSGWSPIYLRDPKGGSIWASIIEKAIAVELKSYENFDSTDIKVKEFWQKITGKEPGGVAIKPDTPLDAIKEAAQNSTTRPTIGATKENGDMRTQAGAIPRFGDGRFSRREGSALRSRQSWQADCHLSWTTSAMISRLSFSPSNE